MQGLLPRAFLPSHEESRFIHKGNIARSRELFLSRRPRNLDYLLFKRYDWMNNYIKPGGKVVELGAGAGLAREYIRNGTLILTDAEPRPWIDEVVDALNPPYPPESLDAVICSHMIHHLAYPIAFFRRLASAIKPGGYILIQEINTSFLLRLMLYVTRHEGWSYEHDAFDENTPANRADDPWSANCAIPEMLFRDAARFEAQVPQFSVVKNEVNECFIFPLSGGVVVQTRTINLPRWALRCVDALDHALIAIVPGIFGCGRSVVLRRR
ncbi:MAG: methyltransferase domain-containing protein [Alphaproteobacteria bacterium]|nr:methyltransferase domain-containing protein [Alphaproteobacteria bacterium]